MNATMLRWMTHTMTATLSAIKVWLLGLQFNMQCIFYGGTSISRVIGKMYHIYIICSNFGSSALASKCSATIALSIVNSHGGEAF